MKYRCLTCGFSQDFIPTQDDVEKHHPWMKGKNVLDCPACTDYEMRGGRKSGKIKMPHFEVIGILVEETEAVLNAVLKQNEDMRKIIDGDTKVKNKYKGKRIWGYSPEEIEAINTEKN